MYHFWGCWVIEVFIHCNSRFRAAQKVEMGHSVCVCVCCPLSQKKNLSSITFISPPRVSLSLFLSDCLSFILLFVHGEFRLLCLSKLSSHSVHFLFSVLCEFFVILLWICVWSAELETFVWKPSSIQCWRQHDYISSVLLSLHDSSSSSFSLVIQCHSFWFWLSRV